MISLRGAPLLRPFLIFGFLGMALIASFSRILGYWNHWRDIWWAWVIGGLTAIYLVLFLAHLRCYKQLKMWGFQCHNVLCFQEFYHLEVEKPPPEERISPFFSWFRLPRVQAKEPTYR